MIRAELRHVTEGASFPVLLAVAAVLNVLAVLGTSQGMELGSATSDAQAEAAFESLVGLGFGASLFSMIHGALVVTRDFQSCSIWRASILHRGPDVLLRRRLVALSVPAVAFAAVGVLAAGVPAYLAVSQTGYNPGLTDHLRTALPGVAATIVLSAWFGHLVGWLLRRSIAAIVLLVAWTLFVETSVLGLSDTVGRYLPGPALQAAMADPTATADLLGVGAGYLVYAGWLVALGALAVLTLRRRDLV
ncbi:MAG: hypothetical protein HGA44_04540 [Cellulomonadaceae bacterium]|nr:hypothetical protein [Cellulomonadaceae bacterium]